VLEDALASWEGTLLFVSHDRAFVNAVATRVVEVRAGQLREFHGNYDDYLAAMAREAAPEAPIKEAARGGTAHASGAAGPPAAERAARKRAERARSEPQASEVHQAGRRAEPIRTPAHQQVHRKEGLEGLPSAPPAHSKPSSAEARQQQKARRREEEKATRQLARIEATIAEREKALEEMAWRLADPAVLRDGERARALDAERTALRAEVDALYAEWETWAAVLEDAAPAEEAG
jgi:ATP-binding cassette subfamily F protein 3